MSNRKIPRDPSKPGDVDDPQWDGAGRVHEWRNYVGDRTRAIWPQLTTEQRLAIAQDADDRASNEEWD